MENKTLAKANASRKTIQNHEVEKLMQELNNYKTGTAISLREYEILLAKAKRVSEKLKDSTILEKAVIIVGEKLIKIGSKEQAGRNTRISSLETALKLLFDFYGKQKNKPGISLAILALIARACYERSVLILSKQDKVMVEKKKRIIKKGVAFVEKAIDKESNNKEALRLKNMLLLELEKVDKDDRDVSDLKEVLSSAIQKGCTEFGKNADDIEIALRLAEFTKKDGDGKPLSEDICESLKNIVNSSLQTRDIELKKAKAHYLQGNDTEVINCMKSFIGRLSSLKLPFSDPVWSEAAEFVRRVKEDKSDKDYWKELALMFWKACKDQERISSSLHLFWYWGHLVTQYFIADLAFLAVDTVKEKSKIADFVKSQLQFHTLALESEVGKIYETQASARQAKFIKELEEIYKIEYEKYFDVNLRNIEDIGERKNWMVVHFYLCNYEKQGYALIFDSDSKTWWEKPETFSYTELFNKFLTWQTNYNLFGFPDASNEKIKTSEFLVELCRKIGDDMKFLFKIPDKKYVLFVPHSFLHLIPLHAAITECNKVFLENHPCAYLPAFFLAQKSNKVNSKEYIVFKNLREGEEYYIKKAFPEWVIESAKEANPDDIRNIHSPPKLFILICHGQADVANPFNSILKLKDGSITHLDLLVAEKINLKGSHVVLGACETDMAYPFTNILDDHVSISTAFLIKGAPEILGTMWIVYFNKVGEILNRWWTKKNAETNLFLEVNEWQEQQIKIWKEKNNVVVFYKTVVFRVIGFPL